jgi:lipopolysaccharide transport system ATP-binding protein
MSDSAIRVENLSKKYILGHQKQEKYTTLRESISNGSRNLLKGFRGEKSTKESAEVEEFWALKNVSFEIKQGERVGIIGRNGAGKSTLLKILSRITEPTSGKISIQGRVASLLEVGTGFHPELSGRENVYLNGAILGMSKVEIESRFDEIIAFAEVEKFLDTPVKRYSSGMYVRLAFAVAAHLDPEILIVDEVLAVGDLQFQKKCLGKMGEISQGGRTIIFVSHSMGAISTLCNKAVFLEKGEIREVGTVDRITASYMDDMFQNKIDDLEQLRLPGFGYQVYFSDIQLITGNNSSIAFGEPIIYSLTIKSDIKVQDLIIGTSIFNRSDICVGSLLTRETLSIDVGEEIVVELQISNTNIVPGSYYASFGINQKGGGSNFDAVIGKPAFQIRNATEASKEYLARWQSGWGDVFFKDYQLLVNGNNENRTQAIDCQNNNK